tara:strand:+ start:491 stop:664 length:174 start_codon:yes stop_codon:yes gene_type:complete
MSICKIGNASIHALDRHALAAKKQAFFMFSLLMYFAYKVARVKIIIITADKLKKKDK